MKKVITTYTLEQREIEEAVMEVLRRKYPELQDEFEGDLSFSKGPSLKAYIRIEEEKD